MKLVFVQVFLFVHVLGWCQVEWDTEIKKCFREEEYSKVIALCEEDARKYPPGYRTAHDLPRKQMLAEAKKCSALIDSARNLRRTRAYEAKSLFEQVMAIRNEIWDLIGDKQPVRHPETALWIADIEHTRPAVVSSPVLSSFYGIRAKVIENVCQFFADLNNSFFSGEERVKTDLKYCTAAFEKHVAFLWETDGHFRCTANGDHIVNYPLVSTTGGWYMNVPVAFEQNEKSMMTLEFTYDGKINYIKESLPELRYNKVEYTAKVDSAHLEEIRDFVETFRIAYKNKDIDFIEKAFSEHAIIITGKDKGLSIKTANEVPVPEVSESSRYKFDKQSKEQYINKLKRVFDKNKRINVEFSDIEVQRHHEFGFLYGVTLKQMWYSDVYSDTGWVFLLIKFRQDEEPLIFVRTWQPVSCGKENVFRFNDFELH